MIPFIVGEGFAALAVAGGLAALALFGVGVLTSLFTARPPVRAGLRMVTVGALAAIVTYLVGSAVGVAVD